MKKVRFLNDYKVIYLPNHRKSMTSENWLGWVYEHIVIAEKLLNRELREKEEVHHLDGDRSNNRPENLIVLEKSQHQKLHGWINRGAPFLKKNGEQRINSEKANVSILNSCKICGIALNYYGKKYCSSICSGLSSRKVKWPSKSQLIEDIKTMPWVRIGKKYGVSDNAVRKWAAKYKIDSKAILSQVSERHT